MTKIDPTQTISWSPVTHRDCSLIYLSHLQTVSWSLVTHTDCSLIMLNLQTVFPGYWSHIECCSLVIGHPYTVPWSMVTPTGWCFLIIGETCRLSLITGHPYRLFPDHWLHAVLHLQTVLWSLVTPSHLLPDHWLHQQTCFLITGLPYRLLWSLVTPTDCSQITGYTFRLLFTGHTYRLVSDHWLHLETAVPRSLVTHTVFPDHWLHLQTCSLITGYSVRLFLITGHKHW